MKNAEPIYRATWKETAPVLSAATAHLSWAGASIAHCLQYRIHPNKTFKKHYKFQVIIQLFWFPGAIGCPDAHQLDYTPVASHFFRV